MSSHQSIASLGASWKERGLTLVELLVGMALGLIVLAAIGYIYSGSRQSYVQQDNLARLQENGRYALELLGQEIRMAGYIGCPNIGMVTPTVQANNAPFTSLGLTGALVRPVTGVLADGINNAVTTNISTNQVSGTDLLIIHRASGTGFPLSANMVTTADAIQMTGSPRGLKHGDNNVLVISDCTQADIFCASSVAPVNPDGANATVGHDGSAGACNNASTLSKIYRTNAMVMGLETAVYYIRNQSTGNPALYVTRWAPDAAAGGDTDEVLPNVENMRVYFGLDTDNNGSVDQYVRSAAVGNWAQVRAVRVSLLMRSSDNGVAPQAQTYVYDANGDGTPEAITAASSDRRLRQVYTTTVAIRNRAMGGI
ncbi:MAG TPA: PilW family protein [Thiobacillaceae bacterium]|nr:PilW family protein [Thiobacillaceae bacterium]